MKRTFVLLAVVSAVAALSPVRADTDEIVIPGFVQVATTHPALARTLYLQDEKTNGAVGFVIELPVPIEHDTPFELVPDAGATGLEDLDAYFYLGLEGTGDPCPYTRPEVTPRGGEKGTVCAGATHAVIVLFQGADVEFTLVLPDPTS